MNQIPVVHIITKMELGGAQQVALDILSQMDHHRFTPVLITGPEGYLLDEARSMGFEVHIAKSMEREIRPVRDFVAYREIREILSGIPEAAVVHTHSSKAGILGRWAAAKAGIPVIIHTIHGFGIPPTQPLYMRSVLRIAERLTSRISTHLVAVSESNRSDGVRWGIFGADKCSVIYCGFDLEPIYTALPIREDLESSHGIPLQAPLVLMVACLKPQKAPLDYVRVAETVHGSRPDAHFMVAGDGELAGEMVREVKRAGLEEKFHLLGWRNDVFSLMKSSDLVVLTSLWEGLPLVIPQAHAAGKPFIATSVDGSVEAIADGVNGFLCPPRESGAMADRILTILSDPDLAKRMGDEGKERAKLFNRERMVRMYEDLYSKLLDEKGVYPGS
ncbi:MAG: glycosyltransferase family 4 protein [bacterium]